MGLPPRVARVKRELLSSCMTCPLCHKLLNEATTISECLHTFCRKCIFDKLTDEEVNCCPICNVDLGSVPVEKLRPDHNLQDVRAKIFPFKSRKVNHPEVPLISLPVRRKERSLSSLVVSTPQVVVTQTGLTGRRTKAVVRRATALHRLTAVNGSTKKDAVNAEDRAENSNLSKFAENRKQTNGNSSNAEPSSRTSNDIIENGESYLDKTELWKPLNSLVEAAKLKSNPQSPVMMEEKIHGPGTKVHIPKIKVREHLNKSRVQNHKNGNIPASPGSVKAKRLCGISRKRWESATSAQALLDATCGRSDERISPIWFSLVAAADQDGDASLPQLSANYLMIKDGNLPTSFIQKYLTKKLDLASETVVDISCRGQPVDPTLPLHGLVDMWLRTGSSHNAQTSVGSSAKDFVMVLTYRHKPLAP